MRCGWGVKAGCIIVWVAGKTVWSLVNTCHSERFRGESYEKALYKCPLFKFFFNFKLISHTEIEQLTKTTWWSLLLHEIWLESVLLVSENMLLLIVCEFGFKWLFAPTLKAGYSDFWSFKIKCIIKRGMYSWFRKNIMKNYFCILRDIFSFKDFLTRLPSTNFLQSD